MKVIIMSKFIDAAKWLDKQHRSRSNFENFNNKFDLFDLEDAYEVQDALEKVWCRKGKLAGYKLALTSTPIQALFGVDTPIKVTFLPKLFCMVINRSQWQIMRI